MIKELIRELERGKLPGAPVDKERADAYDRERIAEQESYFNRSVRVVGQLLKSTRMVFVALLVIALAASLSLLLFKYFDLQDGETSNLVLHWAMALITLFLTARAIFGWEARLSIYEPMLDERAKWLEERKALRLTFWGDVSNPDWQLRFKQLAAAIEIAMAREALEWLKVVEREVYEAPI